jgi:hypothetical protein
MKKLLWLIMVLVLLSGSGFIYISGSCQRPLPWQKEHCQEMEQAILDATVRIVFHGSIEIENGYEVQQIPGTISHATVVDGRYLLTHNHFGIPLSQVQLYNRHSNGGFQGVSVYRLDGTAVLDHAPLDIFVVTAEKGETVLLDFGTVADEGLFKRADVSSAQVVPSDAVRLVPGTEVAQVDWDRQSHTEVTWTQIQTVYQDDGLPLMQVDHLIESGASGGGVFLNGKHIGNNWGHIIFDNPNRNPVRQRLSLVALNT